MSRRAEIAKRRARYNRVGYKPLVFRKKYVDGKSVGSYKVNFTPPTLRAYKLKNIARLDKMSGASSPTNKTLRTVRGVEYEEAVKKISKSPNIIGKRNLSLDNFKKDNVAFAVKSGEVSLKSDKISASGVYGLIGKGKNTGYLVKADKISYDGKLNKFNKKKLKINDGRGLLNTLMGVG